MDQRVKSILSAIISNYIQTSEPVGSRTLSKALNINLSPATIRNVMADLSEAGYLEQPHTSAGRVPTDKAYRFYVDSLVTANTLPQELQEMISRTLGEAGPDLEKLLSNATRLLADLTHLAGVISAPRADRARLKMIEFLKVSSRHVFVILITRSNMVHNKIIETTEELTQENLNAIAAYLNNQFSDCSLVDIRHKVMESLVEEKARYDQMLAHVVRLGKKAFEFPDTGGLLIEGQSNLVHDFADMDKLQRLLKTLEEKLEVVGILDKALQAGGVQIYIGMENSQKNLQDCSVISAQYGGENNILGAVGVIGPTRMDYPRIIPIVDYTARILSQSLAKPQ